jgi:hypothetical protein
MLHPFCDQGGNAVNTQLIAGLTGWNITGILAVLTALGALARKVWPFGRKLVHFIDDWFGEPARDGVPERAGVMARLATIDEHAQRTDERLDVIEHELKPNSGKSLHDKVTQMAKTTERIELQVNQTDPGR